MKCYGCLKSTKDSNYLTCLSENCQKSFCSLCINRSTLSTEKIKSWKCPDCSASQRKGGDNSTTPVRSALSDNVTKRKKVDAQDSSTNSEVKELIEEVRILTQEISCLKKHLEEATISLINCQSKLEELTSSISVHDKRITVLEDREREVKLLNSKVSDLRQELSVQAQYQLRNELELAGIPENANENPHHIALLAVRKVGVDLNDSDIDWVTRVGPRVKSALAADQKPNFPRPIVVRLLRRSKRDQIIKAAKSRRNISSGDIEIPGTSQKIYYNERLTKENRLLFRAARAKCKEQGYIYCWCTQGTIYVKQREGKPALSVRTQDDLLRIFGPTNDN